MAVTANIAEAKARLSHLIDAALLGQEVVIARRGTPEVKLVPLTPPRRRELGFVPGHLPDTFFDALPDDELEAWSL